jgi:hypothetical protein
MREETRGRIIRIERHFLLILTGLLRYKEGIGEEEFGGSLISSTSL